MLLTASANSFGAPNLLKIDDEGGHPLLLLELLPVLLGFVLVLKRANTHAVPQPAIGDHRSDAMSTMPALPQLLDEVLSFLQALEACHLDLELAVRPCGRLLLGLPLR